MTDTAEGQSAREALDVRKLRRGLYSPQRDQGAERQSPEAGTRITDKPGQNQSGLLNENNHRKRNQCND